MGQMREHMWQKDKEETLCNWVGEIGPTEEEFMSIRIWRENNA